MFVSFRVSSWIVCLRRKKTHDPRTRTNHHETTQQLASGYDFEATLFFFSAAARFCKPLAQRSNVG